MTKWLSDAQSVALFGSHARGDADSISDSDLLIVDADPEVLSLASARLRSRGFSCATYTWERLEHMKARGSLFLQHLKTESIVLADRESRLANLLQMFQPNSDYSRDIHATKQILSLTEYVSDTKHSIGWACDVLAVAVRNIGILELANRGQYTFSSPSILESLVQIGVLRETDISPLQQLRLYKSFYRNRRYEALPTLDALNDIQRIICRRFRVDCNFRILSPESLAADFLAKSGRHPDKYCRLRLLEGATISCFDGLVDLPHDSSRRFRRLIENQNQYGLFWRDLSIPLRENAVDIINCRWGKQPLVATRPKFTACAAA